MASPRGIREPLNVTLCVSLNTKETMTDHTLSTVMLGVKLTCWSLSYQISEEVLSVGICSLP